MECFRCLSGPEKLLRILILLTEARDRDEKKENMQLNAVDSAEQHKTQNLTTESAPNRTTNPVIQFQALRAVQCVTTGDPEDSPVKSLRKWVDGCFHNTPVSLVNTSSSTCETPPSTPPHKSSTEASVIIAGKVEGRIEDSCEIFSCLLLLKVAPRVLYCLIIMVQ